MSAPFRTWLRTTQESSGSSDPVEAELARIRADTTPEDQEPDQLRFWLGHPDERVVVAALDRWDLAVHESRSLSRELLGHATRRAEADGLFWTPVLDRIAATDLWPEPAPELWEVRYDMRAAIQQLTPWLTEQAELDDVKELARSSAASMLLRLVATRAREMDLELVQILAESGVSLRFIVQNEAPLPEGTVQALTQHVLARAKESTSGSTMVVHELSGMLDELRVRAHPLSAADVDALLEVRLVEKPQSSSVLLSLLVHNALPAERMIDLYHAAQECDILPDPLFNQHTPTGTPIEFFRMAARELQRPRVQSVIMDTPKAAHDAEVRQSLIQHARFPVLEKLAARARPAEIGPILRSMVRVSPEELAAWLERGGLPRHVVIRPEDLAPLLECRMREVRLAALTRLAQHGARRATDGGRAGPRR